MIAPPRKRQRRTCDEADNLAELTSRKAVNDNRLKSAFESIFTKYNYDFSGLADEIDLETGEIVVDNGHVRTMEQDPGEEAGYWGETEDEATREGDVLRRDLDRSERGRQVEAPHITFTAEEDKILLSLKAQRYRYKQMAPFLRNRSRFALASHYGRLKRTKPELFRAWARIGLARRGVQKENQRRFKSSPVGTSIAGTAQSAAIALPNQTPKERAFSEEENELLMTLRHQGMRCSQMQSYFRNRRESVLRRQLISLCDERPNYVAAVIKNNELAEQGIPTTSTPPLAPTHVPASEPHGRLEIVSYEMKPRKWTPEEDALLLQLRGQGIRYSALVPRFHNKAKSTIRLRYNLLVTGTRKSPGDTRSKALNTPQKRVLSEDAEKGSAHTGFEAVKPAQHDEEYTNDLSLSRSSSPDSLVDKSSTCTRVLQEGASPGKPLDPSSCQDDLVLETPSGVPKYKRGRPRKPPLPGGSNPAAIQKVKTFDNVTTKPRAIVERRPSSTPSQQVANMDEDINQNLPLVIPSAPETRTRHGIRYHADDLVEDTDHLTSLSALPSSYEATEITPAQAGTAVLQTQTVATTPRRRKRKLGGRSMRFSFPYPKRSNSAATKQASKSHSSPIHGRDTGEEGLRGDLASAAERVIVTVTGTSEASSHSLFIRSPAQKKPDFEAPNAENDSSEDELCTPVKF